MKHNGKEIDGYIAEDEIFMTITLTGQFSYVLKFEDLWSGSTGFTLDERVNGLVV